MHQLIVLLLDFPSPLLVAFGSPHDINEMVKIQHHIDKH